MTSTSTPNNEPEDKSSPKSHSESNPEIYDVFRKSWQAATPEEKIRQQLLSRMVDQLGYPPNLLVIEKALHQLPHLALRKDIPLRRADIICFAKGIHPSFDLYPLLMIECKAATLTTAVIRQVVGYNYYVQALFVAVANETEERTGWYNTKADEYTFVPHLPSFNALMATVGNDSRLNLK